jgi:uncharacterized protein (DUF885 family)
LLLLATAPTLPGCMHGRTAPPATAAPAPDAPGAPASAGTGAAAAKVSALADALVREVVARYPEEAEGSGLSGADPAGLSDNSPEALAAWRALEDRWLAELSQVDGRALFGTPAWITHGFLREALESSVGARVCKQELWPVNQMSGIQMRLMDLAERQPVGTPEKRAAALARFGKVPRYLENELAQARAGLEAGYSSPKRNVQLVVAQLDAVLAAPVAESPYASPATRDTDAAFRAQWLALVEGQLNPALRRYRDFLAAEYLPKAADTHAITRNPDGRACYQALFRSTTGLTRTPEETYALGERTVQGNLAGAAKVGQEAFGTSDIAQLVARADSDPANRFASDEELLAFARDAVKRSREGVARFFVEMPRADAVVLPYPKEAGPSAPERYEPPAEDGSRPGVYRIQLASRATQRRSKTETTAFHELWPGHHLQIALAHEAKGLHPVTKLVGSGAFIEGWGRYAEALAEEAGLYTSAHARISRRLWPARGMVLDPGLHLFGWSRERAEQYMRESGRFSEAEVKSLTERIAMWPSQLTSYDTGALEIFALRREAERRLGPRFDLKVFHQKVLENGAVTLPMLREQVEAWLAKEGARAAAAP